MKKNPMRQNSIYRELARERIEKLFALASECFGKKPQLANRYVDLARSIGMKCRVRIPPHLKMRFCKQCGSFLVAGVNSRVRIRPDGKGRVVITCLKCGMIKRYPMKREKLKRRKDVTGSAEDPR
jgi:ribonuclease P protein subunit RPR2